MIELTDEVLVAYVDGELPQDTSLAVEAGIAKDPEAQAKVKDMRDTAALLRAAFPEELPAENVVQLKSPSRGGFIRSRPVLTSLAAAAAILLVIGAGLVASPFHGEDRAEFMADVAAYHAVYAQETEHLAEVPAARKDHIEQWLGSRLGRPLKVPDLSAEGWIFEGGRLLAEGELPIAQLLYTAPNRQPIAVCITRSAQPESEPVQYDPGKGVRVAAWDGGGYLYIVVGALAPPELDRLSHQVKQQYRSA